jgi:hypothetical protein
MFSPVFALVYTSNAPEISFTKLAALAGSTSLWLARSSLLPMSTMTTSSWEFSLTSSTHFLRACRD